MRRHLAAIAEANRTVKETYNRACGMANRIKNAILLSSELDIPVADATGDTFELFAADGVSSLSKSTPASNPSWARVSRGSWGFQKLFAYSQAAAFGDYDNGVRRRAQRRGRSRLPLASIPARAWQGPVFSHPPRAFHCPHIQMGTSTSLSAKTSLGRTSCTAERAMAPSSWSRGALLTMVRPPGVRRMLLPAAHPPPPTTHAHCPHPHSPQPL